MYLEVGLREFGSHVSELNVLWVSMSLFREALTSSWQPSTMVPTSVSHAFFFHHLLYQQPQLWSYKMHVCCIYPSSVECVGWCLTARFSSRLEESNWMTSVSDTKVVASNSIVQRSLTFRRSGLVCGPDGLLDPGWDIQLQRYSRATLQMARRY